MLLRVSETVIFQNTAGNSVNDTRIVQNTQEISKFRMADVRDKLPRRHAQAIVRRNFRTEARPMLHFLKSFHPPPHRRRLVKLLTKPVYKSGNLKTVCKGFHSNSVVRHRERRVRNFLKTMLPNVI